MKSVVTIRREIARLRGMSQDMNLPPHSRGEAYEAYHALRWTLEDVTWRPSTLIRKAVDAAKLTLPATEVFYQCAMERSAEIKAAGAAEGGE